MLLTRALLTRGPHLAGCLQRRLSAPAGYVFVASMDVKPGSIDEKVFDEIYEEHVQLLLAVPGVRAVRRYLSEPCFQLSLGGATHSIPLDSEPTYCAEYEIDSPAVLTSEAWAVAIEDGRWAAEARQHTTNRKHVLRRLLSSTVDTADAVDSSALRLRISRHKRALLVTGDTYHAKDLLKQLGGFSNPFVEGWIFRRTGEESVVESLRAQSGVEIVDER
jgi:hypothetical protein